MIKRNARFNYLICIYLLGIVFFTLFRIAETVAYCAHTDGPDDFGGQYLHALWLGFRFDTVVSTYFLALPLLMIIIGEMAHIVKRWYYAVIHYMLMMLYTVAFLVCAADIPYFIFFFIRFDITAFTLADAPGPTLALIFSNVEYMAYLLAFLVVAVVWWLLGSLLYKKILLPGLNVRQPLSWSIPLTVVLVGMSFVGMRGDSFTKASLRTSDAYFCHNPFLNQLNLNPVFTFVKSVQAYNNEKSQPIELIDLETAQREFDSQWLWPKTEGEVVKLPKGTNVVIVLMESMSVEYTMLGTNPAASHTRFLDSVMKCGITFTEAWSAGTQSYNGFYSTHYGHPTIFKRHSLRQGITPLVCGLPNILRDNGYKTMYLMCHAGDFDGNEPFMYANGYDKVYEQSSYPEEEVVGPYGIPDHTLFRHAIEHCNEAAKEGPFYATVATCSNHPPLIIPEGIGFKSRYDKTEDQIVEYADWSMQQFMKDAAKQPWFENTLFVFVADHGCEDKNQIYDIPIARMRIPITYYMPSRLKPRMITRPALQLDVAPTILGMLDIEYNNRMLGQDALKYQRQIAAFGTWETIGASDGEFLYIYRKNDGSSSLYRYKERSREDLSSKYLERKERLGKYALSLVQLSYQMLMDGSTACK